MCVCFVVVDDLAVWVATRTLSPENVSSFLEGRCRCATELTKAEGSSHRTMQLIVTF